MKNFLIINPFGIGDVLFTTPLIHSIRDKFPQAKIGYLCNLRAKELLKNNPYVDRIFVYERDEFQKARKASFFLWVKKFLAFLKGIRKERFNVAIDLSLNYQYGFFCWLSGIKERFGYDFKNRGRFLTRRVKFYGYNEKHVAQHYEDLLKYLDVEPKYKNLELYIDEDDLRSVEKILEKEGIDNSDILVAIIPGAGKSWGKDATLKHWGANNFARLADKIVENYKAKIIILGDFFEQELGEGVAKDMQCNSLNLAGKTSLGELGAVLSKARIVISNDGGPLHMAVALGVKTVSIFGPVDENVYGPYPPSPDHAVIKKDLSCRPCYKDFRMSECIYNRKCIGEINVDEVFQEVRRLIA